MRRIMLVVSLMAMLVFSAVPALADNGDERWDDRWDDRQEELFFDGFFFDGFFFDEDFEDFEDFERFNDFDGDLSQDVEQDAESGDVDQSFDVSQTGDNSNQCVSTQGVANTGNAQNVTDITQLGAQEDDFNDLDRDGFFDGFDRFDGDGGDLEFEEVGATIEVNPTNTPTCDQQVNQAATASG